MADGLKEYIQRVAALLVDRLNIDADIGVVLESAGDAGFDKAAIRRIATVMAKDKAEDVAKRRALDDEYAAAVGVQLELSFYSMAEKIRTGEVSISVGKSEEGPPDIPGFLDRRVEAQPA